MMAPDVRKEPTNGTIWSNLMLYKRTELRNLADTKNRRMRAPEMNIL
jgi:hypothetical protein